MASTDRHQLGACRGNALNTCAKLKLRRVPVLKRCCRTAALVVMSWFKLQLVKHTAVTSSMQGESLETLGTIKIEEEEHGELKGLQVQ